MEFNELHFAYPQLLWILCAIPVVWLIICLFYKTSSHTHQLEKFIDSHLLPYLLINQPNKKRSIKRYLLLWSVVWALLTLSLAGPRWSFREVETFSKDQSLVVLLDLSKSMDVTDVKPSRLIRAKQKIEDLINQSKGVKIGLIAFAADPHMITPLTDDIKTIRHLLPTLDTDLVHIQGSRLAPALDMASQMLEAEPGRNKVILVIADGGFEDASAVVTAKAIAEKGMIIHTMGVGSMEGAPMRDLKGNIVKKNGSPILSKLDQERLRMISQAGNGRYFEAQSLDEHVNMILIDLDKQAEAQLAMGKKDRFWDEHFYLLILPVLPMLLFWFRRGYVFALFACAFFPLSNIQADVVDYFYNSEQRGQEAYADGDYDKAIHAFQDQYRKGVSCYKAGQYAEAEKLFRECAREDVSQSAEYNLGNTLVQQNKLKKAKKVYENFLKKYPDHIKAKENLELVKKMIESQKNENEESKNSDQKDDNDQDDLDQQEGKDQNSHSKDNQDNQKNNNDQDSDDKEDQNQDGQDKDDDSPHDQENEKNENNQDSQDNQNDDQSKNQNNENEEDENQAEKSDSGSSENDDLSEDNQATESLEETTEESEISKSQADHDADLWLNRISNDPKMFMKNKFYIESKTKGTRVGIDPW